MRPVLNFKDLSKIHSHSLMSPVYNVDHSSDQRVTSLQNLVVYFHDRFSSLRCEGFDLRAEARAAQPSSVTPQSINL